MRRKMKKIVNHEMLLWKGIEDCWIRELNRLRGSGIRHILVDGNSVW